MCVLDISSFLNFILHYRCFDTANAIIECACNDDISLTSSAPFVHCVDDYKRHTCYCTTQANHNFFKSVQHSANNDINSSVNVLVVIITNAIITTVIINKNSSYHDDDNDNNEFHSTTTKTIVDSASRNSTDSNPHHHDVDESDAGEISTAKCQRRRHLHVEYVYCCILVFSIREVA